MDNTSIINHYMHQSFEYACASCLKIFPLADELQKHLMEAHAHHLYKCSLCKLVFDSKVDIQVHFAVKHSNECTVFKCTRCPDLKFRSEVEWQLHVKFYHLGLSKPYRCLFCKDSFLTESELLVHISMHEKQFVCSICDESFLVEYLLDKHLELHHSSNSVNAEMVNKNKFSIKRNKFFIALHPIVMAEDAKYSPSSVSSKPSSSPKCRKQFKCQVCELKFCGESNVNKHMLREHNIDVNCHNVSASAAPEPSTSFSNEKSSQVCVYCKQTFKSKLDLDKHMKLHHILPSNQKCNICDEVFSSSVVLAEHKLTHCKVVQSNLCTVCKIVLKNEEDYFSHCHEHSSQGTNMQCIICRQTLSSALEMHLHGKHHFQATQEFKEKKERCDLCSSYINSNDKIPDLSNSLFKNKMNVCIKCYKMEYADFTQSLTSPQDQTNHKNLKSYQCIKCQESFHSEYEIQLHVASHVIAEGNVHKCNLCARKFDSPAKLQLHLVEHSFEDCDQMLCYLCNESFEQACDIQQHMLTNHGISSKKYFCNLCSLKYFFSAELLNHRISYHNHDISPSSSFDFQEPVDGNSGLDNSFKSEHQKNNLNSVTLLQSHKIEKSISDDLQISYTQDYDNKLRSGFPDFNFKPSSKDSKGRSSVPVTTGQLEAFVVVNKL
ncbi:hypothetical protein HELRODRAFT_72973 [Helobdella robusta]|uniref:C2H2-type domain-containing protein n=1 Tax=Helobdella robusta TaxID=6412 RepID=T1G181_HELRO|nr:hypothetical protein HELRODRAFT_72973 [Helobdella robusta]ESO10198.1 hypothetical protein HELRODRAFT_72973 [Helobdella robusta]